MTAPARQEGETWTCPRCGDTIDTLPALSRTSDPERDPIEICAACGTDETLLHQDGLELPTRDAWPVARRPEADPSAR